jgi:flagellar protein FlaG
MNSEISNVLKSSPLTVLKADKNGVERRSSTTNKSVLDSKPFNTDATDKNSAASFLNQDNKEIETPESIADKVKRAVDEGNSLLQAVRRNLRFQVDETTQELVVKIVDSDSGDTVRQIPSEEMLAFIRRLQEMEGQQGSMIQDQA